MKKGCEEVAHVRGMCRVHAEVYTTHALVYTANALVYTMCVVVLQHDYTHYTAPCTSRKELCMICAMYNVQCTMYTRVPESCVVLVCTGVCIGVYRCAQVCTGVFRCVQMCTGVYRCV